MGAVWHSGKRGSALPCGKQPQRLDSTGWIPRITSISFTEKGVYLNIRIRNDASQHYRKHVVQHIRLAVDTELVDSCAAHTMSRIEI